MDIVDKFAFLQKYFGKKLDLYERLNIEHNNYIYELIRKDCKNQPNKTLERYNSLSNVVGNKKWYETKRNMELALSYPCTTESFYFLMHGFIIGSINENTAEDVLDKMIEHINSLKENETRIFRRLN